MGKVYVDFDHTIPRYACTDCMQCTSTMGISLCETKNRGCCYYFPKFTLLDIHRMVKSIEGLQILDDIMQQPGTVVYRYYVHAKGSFDESGYEQYIKNDDFIIDDTIEDQTVFFKTCPFAKGSYGCTIPPRFRTYICNFFICKEIVESASAYNTFELYLHERAQYVKWIEWENASLQHLLIEHNIDLISNFKEVVKVLQDIPVNQYEFPPLPLIETDDNVYIGA